jgi:error-prone DNA polymerase
LPIDVNHSAWGCTLERSAKGTLAVRLGLRYVKGLAHSLGEVIAAERALAENGEVRPYTSAAELVLRLERRGAHAPESVLETLAEVGALASLGLARRAALWQVAAVARESRGVFAGVAPDDASPLAEMSPLEETAADYAHTGVTTGPHPMAHLRERLSRHGVWRAADLARGKNGAWVKVAGMVIVRQRPGTAKGFVFLTLEDETGVTNAILTPQIFEAFRKVVVGSPFLVVEGPLQVQDNVVHVKARRIDAMNAFGVSGASHDFY